MENDVAKILLPQEELAEGIKRLGREISADYEGKELLIICVLKGSFVFAADLMRQITIPCSIDFMAVSSYGAGTTTSGEVKIMLDVDTTLNGKHILIAEDILDSGVTLSYLLNILSKREPASLKVCTLLNKEDRRKTFVPVAYKGFDVPDEFLVGYGLDYAEKYRNLPFVGVLKREIYE